jgi:hypothetical protein
MLSRTTILLSGFAMNRKECPPAYNLPLNMFKQQLARNRR